MLWSNSKIYILIWFESKIYLRIHHSFIPSSCNAAWRYHFSLVIIMQGNLNIKHMTSSLTHHTTELDYSASLHSLWFQGYYKSCFYFVQPGFGQFFIKTYIRIPLYTTNNYLILRFDYCISFIFIYNYNQ